VRHVPRLIAPPLARVAKNHPCQSDLPASTRRRHTRPPPASIGVDSRNGADSRGENPIPLSLAAALAPGPQTSDRRRRCARPGGVESGRGYWNWGAGEGSNCEVGSVGWSAGVRTDRRPARASGRVARARGLRGVEESLPEQVRHCAKVTLSWSLRSDPPRVSP
jgi:hypothetical protein